MTRWFSLYGIFFFKKYHVISSLAILNRPSILNMSYFIQCLIITWKNLQKIFRVQGIIFENAWFWNVRGCWCCKMLWMQEAMNTKALFYLLYNCDILQWIVLFKIYLTLFTLAKFTYIFLPTNIYLFVSMIIINPLKLTIKTHNSGAS